MARKNLQKLRFFYFYNSFLLILNYITRCARNNSNKYLLNELKNRIFARPNPPQSPLQGGGGGGRA